MPTHFQPPWPRNAGDREHYSHPGRIYCSKKSWGLKEQSQPKLNLAMDSVGRCRHKARRHPHLRHLPRRSKEEKHK